MTWDTTLNLDGASMRGATLPTGRHLVEITDFKVGSVEGVGPRGEFTFKAVEGPDKGKTIRMMPYIVGKDFKGSKNQAGWGKDMWFTLLSVLDINTDKVKGKPADKVGKALVGQQLVITVSESPKRENPAEKKAREAKGDPQPLYSNVDLLLPKTEWDGYPLTAPNTSPDVEEDEQDVTVEAEASAANEASSDEDDGFSLDALS